MFKFEIPTYQQVKEFWTGYNTAVKKFWQDFAEDVKKSFDK
jgi:hypothetical protein